MKLSVLNSAGPGTITYYVGDNPEHVAHLSHCILYCKQHFEGLQNVEQRIVEDPQIEFYKLSHEIEDPYSFENIEVDPPVLGKGVKLSPGVVLGRGVIIEDDVHIGPNTVIYAKTKIGRGTRIDANCSIGTGGMMWVWHEGRKLYLQQLGGVSIGEDCIIGSNCAIVRGSANETTVLEDRVNLAPGCCIGHGTFIGENTHFANNVTLGGSVYIAPNNFIGSAATINPRVRITEEDVILGAGATLTKSIQEEGVYVGNPAKRLKSTRGKMSGVPQWRK